MPFPKIDNAMLDVGSAANQLVQLNSAGKLPAFNASQLTNLPSGGGNGTAGIALLLTQVISSPVGQIDFTSNLDSTYKEYMIRATDVTLSGNGYIGLRVRIGGVFKNSNGYPYSGYGIGNGVGAFGFSSAGDDHLKILPVSSLPYGGSSNAGFIVNITNPAGTTQCKAIHTTGGGNGSNSNFGFSYHASGGWNNNSNDYSAFDGIRLFTSAASINSGTFKLYGIA